jgi:hypothetical protein
LVEARLLGKLPLSGNDIQFNLHALAGGPLPGGTLVVIAKLNHQGGLCPSRGPGCAPGREFII